MQVRNEALSRQTAGSQRVSDLQASKPIEITSYTVPFDAQWLLTSSDLGSIPILHDMDMNFESFANEAEEVGYSL